MAASRAAPPFKVLFVGTMGVVAVLFMWSALKSVPGVVQQDVAVAGDRFEARARNSLVGTHATQQREIPSGYAPGGDKQNVGGMGEARRPVTVNPGDTEPAGDRLQDRQRKVGTRASAPDEPATGDLADSRMPAGPTVSVGDVMTADIQMVTLETESETLLGGDMSGALEAAQGEPCGDFGCVNAGWCDHSGPEPTCMCPDGTHPPRCEKDTTPTTEATEVSHIHKPSNDHVNPCTDSPCQAGGTCVFDEASQSISCNCLPGRSGFYCEEEPSSQHQHEQRHAESREEQQEARPQHELEQLRLQVQQEQEQEQAQQNQESGQSGPSDRLDGAVIVFDESGAVGSDVSVSPGIEHEMCRPKHPDMVVYNRVPKCGSATIMNILHNTKHARGFVETGDEFHGKRRYKEDELRDLALEMFVPPRSSPREFGFFQGHLFYNSWAKPYEGSVEVINVIRHPVERCVSEYNWAVKKMFDKRVVGQYYYKDINQCAADGCFELPFDGVVSTPFVDITTRETASRGQMRNFLKEICNNYYVRWFCGHDDLCMDPSSKKAFDRAMANLRDGHLVVGTTEDLPTTLRLFKKLLPDVFDVDASYFHRAPHLHNMEYVSPSGDTLKYLTDLNKKDMLLYEAVKQRLATHSETCGV